MTLFLCGTYALPRAMIEAASDFYPRYAEEINKAVQLQKFQDVNGMTTCHI